MGACRLGCALLATLVLASPATAQGIVDLEISGNTASARIELPGGVAADLEIAFEAVVGLTEAALGLDAELVSPQDLALLARLPGSLVSIPAAFPILVRIEPPADSPLSFSGVVTVSLHTHNLAYVANCPFRLFKASVGGEFSDVTSSMGTGSYRAGGTSGDFSEFLVVADLRSLAVVSEEKFVELQFELDEYAPTMPAAVAAELQDRLDAALALAAAGEYGEAAGEIQAFGETVVAHSVEMPNVWRASRDLLNVAGRLRAAAATLELSLNLESSQAL